MHLEVKDHKTSMEVRLEYIESLVGDNADRHAKELKSLGEQTSKQTESHGKDLESLGEKTSRQIDDLHRKIKNCAQLEHHSSMEQRMKFLESCLGESSDRHDKHKTTIESRLEYLESLIGDTADKHYKELEAAKRRVGSLDLLRTNRNPATARGASSPHHRKASLAQTAWQ